MSLTVPTWRLRARFAAALSRLYAAEVPLYSKLLEVSTEVNRELGATERVTTERHGAIRVGSPRELEEVADLFAAFGMYPVGFTICATPNRRCRWCRRLSGRLMQTSWSATRFGCSPPCWRRPISASSPRPARPRRAPPGSPAAVRARADRRGAPYSRRGRHGPRVRAALRRRRRRRVRVVTGADRSRVVRRAEPRIGGGRRHRRCRHDAHQSPDAACARHR